MTDEKPKVMLKCEDGFIMSKRQTTTLRDGFVWCFAKNPGTEKEMPGTIEIFKIHGFEIVEWDDDIEVIGGVA